MTTKTRGMLYLGILSVLWGASFLLIQIASRSMPPLAFASTRMLIGAVVLYLFIRSQGQNMPRFGRIWLAFLVLGLFNALFPGALFAFAEKQISSGLAAVLNSTMPIMTVILAHFLADETLTLDRVIGIAVGFAGVLIVLMPTLESGLASGAGGPIAVLLASLLMALAAVYARKYLKDADPAKTATGMMATAAMAGYPLSLIFETPADIRPTTDDLTALGALGILCSAVAFLLYYWLNANRGATFASLVMFTQPPIAIIFAAVFAGSVVEWTTIVGMIVILLCIAIMNGALDRFFGKPAETSIQASV